MGNHDMDLRRTSHLNRFPLFERASQEANWHTAEKLEANFFARRMGNCLVFFLGDHADPEGSWFTTHGGVSGRAPQSYPHSPESYTQLSRAKGEYPGLVIVCSHYALPGGQKPSSLMAQMLPLPANVCLCLHGHAHIGDLVWNKANPWQRHNPVPGHQLNQINISALETTRSPGSHSAFLEIGLGGPIRLRIRCHVERKWVETFQLGGGA